MYQNKYFITKKSGFYQDALLLYGLARFLDMIINKNRDEKIEIILRDCGLYYELQLEDYELKEEDIVCFCQSPSLGFDYIFQESKKGIKLPIHPQTGNLLNLNIIDIQKEWEKLKNQSATKFSENVQSVNPDFSIYALLSHFSVEFLSKEHDAGSTQGGMITRTFLQLFLNMDKFENFIKAILYLFSEPSIFNEKKFNDLAFPKLDKNGQKNNYYVLSKNHKVSNTTFNQLISPPSSKGINSSKLSLTELSGEPNLLIEYLKVLGCFECMFSLGGSKEFEDYRIYVCDPKEINLSLQRNALRNFKKVFFSNSSIKGDIFSELQYSKEIIKHSDNLQEKRYFGFEDVFSPKNYINGFYVCHYMTIKKSPPKKHAPINLSYLKIPTFITAKSIDEANEWLEIIDELITITRSIKGSQKTEESGNVLLGLNMLRTYISSSRIECFLDFQFWYSQYLMFAFNKKQRDQQWYVKNFRTDTLNKLFNNTAMNDLKISEIILNEGFQKVADAIRNSTVILQWAKSRGQKVEFEIRYGLAQKLQEKSRTSNDLAAFIGDFIGTYNAETARKAELEKAFRKPVRVDQLNQFYSLIDKYPSKTVGALLASYGFALAEKETSNIDNNQISENIETVEE